MAETYLEQKFSEDQKRREQIHRSKLESMFLPPETKVFDPQMTDIGMASARASAENEMLQQQMQEEKNKRVLQNQVERQKEKARMGAERMEREDFQRRDREAAERFKRQPFAQGSKFPDLTGDGKVTQADILKGRGVFNEGGSLMVPREQYGVGSFVKASKEVIKALRELSKDNAQGAGVTYDKGFLIREYKTPEALLEAYPDLIGHKELNDNIANELIDSGLEPKSVKKILTEDKFNKLLSRELTEGEKSIRKKVLDKYMARDESGRLLPVKKTPILIEFEKGREPKAEGSMMMPPEGVPVDTYPNIPADEMKEAMASQLPDQEMEDNYIEFIMDESLSGSDQDYLVEVLQKDERLADILDQVILTASEFSGAGEVDGPGTGVSDSIPARLSDGEFVFTKKATDQIGAENLQRMMDDAERAYDGGLQMMAEGGMMGQDEEDRAGQTSSLSKTDEEIKKLMMGSNRMPSLR